MSLIRGLVALGVAGYSSYHFALDTLFPQWSTDLFTIHDPTKLKAIFTVMAKMGIPQREAQNLGVYMGKTNRFLGASFSFPGPALVLKPGLLDGLLLKESDVVYVPGYGNTKISSMRPEVRTKVLADNVIFPFQQQREAIIAHELAHYKLNHNIYSPAIFVGMLSLSWLVYVKPMASVKFMAVYGACLHFLHRKVESEADALAVKHLGRPAAKVMIEMFEAKQQVQKALWDTGLRIEKLKELEKSLS